jgi:hypothetical protein
MGQVSDVSPSQLRVSDSERESALQALGEHMSVGRITLDEYGDRSAKVTAAKTRGELGEIFEDLPQPHPRLDAHPGVAPAPEPAPAPRTEVEHSEAPGTPVPYAHRPVAQRLTAAAVPLASIAAIALFFITGTWLWFLLPAVVAAIGSSLWGQEWKDLQRARRHEDRERHREHRDRHYEMRDHHREMRDQHRDLHRERREEWRDRRRHRR